MEVIYVQHEDCTEDEEDTPISTPGVTPCYLKSLGHKSAVVNGLTTVAIKSSGRKSKPRPRLSVRWIIISAQHILYLNYKQHRTHLQLTTPMKYVL